MALTQYTSSETQTSLRELSDDYLVWRMASTINPYINFESEDVRHHPSFPEVC